jgi:hypothetical protein
MKASGAADAGRRPGAWVDRIGSDGVAFDAETGMWRWMRLWQWRADERSCCVD